MNAERKKIAEEEEKKKGTATALTPSQSFDEAGAVASDLSEGKVTDNSEETKSSEEKVEETEPTEANTEETTEEAKEEITPEQEASAADVEGNDENATSAEEKEPNAPSQEGSSRSGVEENTQTEEESSKDDATAREHRSEGVRPLTDVERALRDEIVSLMRKNGLEVITDEKEGQRVLDWANGKGVRLMAFGEPYDYEQYPLGRVEPNLADKKVEVVHATSQHGFSNYKEAYDWGVKNLCKTYTPEQTGGKGFVEINPKIIDKYISKDARNASSNEDLHYAVLKVIPQIIKNGIDVETHPNFAKKDGKRAPKNGYDKNALVHRVYAAVTVDGQLCRVKITMKENLQDNTLANKPYSYEVEDISTKIESLEPIGDKVNENQVGISNNSISVANLLNGVEMSYNPGAKVLDESKKRMKSAFDSTALDKLEGRGTLQSEVTDVTDLPKDMAYRETDVNELEDILEEGIMREIPYEKTVEGIDTSDSVSRRGFVFNFGREHGRSHGVKAFAKGAPWTIVSNGGSTASGTAQKVIIGFPGNVTQWRTGYHGRYTKPTNFDEIEHGKALAIRFDEDGYIAELPIGQMKVWVYDKEGKLHEFTPYTEDAKITDKVRFFRTESGEAYGYTVGGKIYIDPRIATAETPIHEYAHLWASALKAENPQEWKNVVSLMKGTAIWDEVKERYPELKTDDAIADEVLAHYSGRRGAERLREEERKAKEEKDIFAMAEKLSAIDRLKRALDAFWKGVADFLHIHYTSAEEVADRVMKDLMDGVDPRKFGVDENASFQFVGEKGAVASDIEEVNERFNEQLKTLTERNADSVVFSLGHPSAVLQSAGVENKPMKLYGNKVMKKMRKHGFALEELRDLPRAVADPIAVFNNYGEDGNRSILTELRTRQGNFLVSVNIGKDADVDFNIVRSVFGKGDENVVGWINKGLATYINKKKALTFLSHQSAPIAATAANVELLSATKLVENFENPKVDGIRNTETAREEADENAEELKLRTSEELNSEYGERWLNVRVTGTGPLTLIHHCDILMGQRTCPCDPSIDL